jgi:hypothetical protein
MKTSWTTLAQRQPKAGLETSAPPEPACAGAAGGPKVLEKESAELKKEAGWLSSQGQEHACE